MLSYINFDALIINIILSGSADGISTNYCLAKTFGYTVLLLLSLNYLVAIVENDWTPVWVFIQYVCRQRSGIYNVNNDMLSS